MIKIITFGLSILHLIASIGSMLLGGHQVVTIGLLGIAFFFGSFFFLLNINSTAGK
jgi:hypothetical protein